MSRRRPSHVCAGTARRGACSQSAPCRAFDVTLRFLSSLEDTVAIAGASPQVYAAAMGLASPGEINAKWLEAQAHPIQPVEVSRDRAPVKEVVIRGAELI